jgi:DNA mismatch repair protein MutS
VYQGIDPALEVAAGIVAAVADPGAERLIRPGYDREIDVLAMRAQEARERLLALEAGERERTGIRSLKVGFNSVFGYYIEVSNPNLSKVPAGYVRKQTLAHSERFVTADLLHWEAALAEADTELQALDRARFQALQQAITRESPRILRTAEALARLDVLGALAEIAETRGYTRPELVDSTAIHISGGRHPLVEASLGPGAFIPNDCTLGGDGPALAIVTGPNMGGKSTYLRQVALIVYLAQVGSFVPASAARIGLADRIFARIGAHDDLVAGHSTFLLEMAETAAIVRMATPHSLVLLDEIGRGTTSSDGQAIARAVAEHLHDIVGARTLFATHYHELARAAEGWSGACNLHVRADEHDGQVVFLYRVVEGIADKSFALHVARMAGMPEAITLRAEELLSESIGLSVSPASMPLPGGASGVPAEAPRPIRLAEPLAGAEALLADLLELDLASTTPIEALNSLHSLQQRVRSAHQEGTRRAPPSRGYLA